MSSTYLIVLAMALLSIQSRADPETWDPFTESAEETQYIIDTYAGEELIKYAKSVNVNITVGNNLHESYRYTPFIELLYSNGTSNSDGSFYDVWNSNLVGDQLVNNNPQQLNFSSDEPVVFNFNKQLMFDNILVALPSEDMITPKPLFKSFPFASNPSLNMTLRYFSSLKTQNLPEGQSPMYNAQYHSSVYRQSTFLYYPHTTAFILYYQDPETNEKSIYVMQAFSAGANSQMTPAQLVLNPVASTATTNPLSPSIVVPPNWTFAYIELERMLIVQAYGEARLVSDNLSNAYMYIYRDSSTEWLYSKYDYVSPVKPTSVPSPVKPTSGPAPAPSNSATISHGHKFGAFAAVAAVVGTMFV